MIISSLVGDAVKKKLKILKSLCLSFFLLGFGILSKAEAKCKVVANFFLPNGMQVICIEKKGLPIVSFSVYYKCGSVDEIPSKSGVAHYLEHMAFSDQFMEFLESIGAERNAFTSFRCICFFEVASIDHLDEICSCESDRMKNFSIDPEKFLTEKGAILEERSMCCDNNPAGQSQEVMLATLFNRAAGGTHIVGWRHEIESAEQQDLLEFHDKWMVPNNAIAIIVGDIDLDQIKSLMNKYFAPIKPTNIVRSIEEPQKPEYSKIIERKSAKIGSAAYCDYLYFVPFSVRSDFRKTVVLKLVTSILNQPTYFVRKTLKETLNKADSILFSYEFGSFQYDLFDISFGCSSINNLEDCEELWRYLRNKVLVKGITQQELDVEKRRIAMSLAYRDEDVMGISKNIWYSLMSGYSIDQILEMDDLIQTITVDKCDAVLREVLEQDYIAVNKLLPKEQDR